MSEHDDAMSIKPIHWGALTQLPNGRWLTSWQIDLESLDTIHLAEVATVATNIDAGFIPSLTPQGDTKLLVEIETSRWGMEVDYYGLTYRLFELIDARLGRICFIQGTPREWRNPFRSG